MRANTFLHTRGYTTPARQYCPEVAISSYSSGRPIPGKGAHVDLIEVEVQLDNARHMEMTTQHYTREVYLTMGMRDLPC